MTTLALLFALLLPLEHQDRTRVRAELSQDAARVGETIVLVISVETPSTADIEIKLPQLPSSIVVTGSQESSQLHYSIPGGRRRVLTRELALQPASQGRFQIPAIEVVVGGTRYRTQPLNFQVTGSAASNPGLENREAWLRVDMSPDTVYVGQQTTLTAEAGFSEEVRLRLTRPPIFELPAPTGFWVHDIPGGVRSQLRSVDGRVVEVQTKKTAYFPLNAGRFSFKPARAIVDIRQGFLYAPETREIRSPSPRVTVLPLPEAEKPDGFRGAVGQFEMQSSVEPLSVAAGEPVQITLEISGNGNVKAVAPPALPQLPGAEVFAPTEESLTEVVREVVTGRKTFTYVLIPENEGTLTIPAIKFSFFDPQSRAYRTISTDPVQVRVSAGGSEAPDVSAVGALRPTWTKPVPRRFGWVTTPAFAWAQLIPLLLIIIVFAWQRRTPTVNWKAEYHERLRDVEKMSASDFYRELDRTVCDALETPNIDTTTRERGRTLLERIKSARFAPAPPPEAERTSLLTEARQLIDSIFARRSTRHAAHLLVLIQLGASPADPDDARHWYNLGNAHFQDGNRAAAIASWASALQIAPRNNDIVHNLRTAGGGEALSVRPPLAITQEEWLLIAAALWWIAALFIILTIARRRRLSPWLAAPLIPAVIFALIGVFGARRHDYAVAAADQTALLTEPTVRSQLFRHVRTGALLTILEERDEWLFVRTIDEREAWVAADDVLRVQ